MANNIDKTRKAAVQAVMRVHKGGWANLTVKSMLAESAFSSKEKAFASALFYGTCERLVTLDYLLTPYFKKAITKLDVEVRAILETGLYQIIYMNVPARAAVDEAVKLTRNFGKSSAAGFVNAVLRKAGTTGLNFGKFENELERVCVQYSVGSAVAKTIMQAMPQEYDAFFEASFNNTALCLRVNTLKTTAACLTNALEEAGGTVHAGSLPNCLYAQIAGGVAENPLFINGNYHVQGEVSQYACAYLDAKQGEKVLDLCAAPGGKSATIAQNMGGGAGLTACEIRENRLPLVEEIFARLGINEADIMLNDASVFNKALAGQDKILCDVPCSGLGVLASKPDIRYTTGKHFETLPALQKQILTTAASYLNKGGRLIYSTCTVRPEENEQVVQAFLNENKDFIVVLPSKIPKGVQTHQNMLTFLPHSTGLDGFFVASLERL